MDSTPTMDPSPALERNHFLQHFAEESHHIRSEMRRLATLSKIPGERQDAIEYILSRIQRLTTETADASSFLPSYDQEACVRTLKSLNELLREAQSQAGIKRFSFKRPAPGGVSSGRGVVEGDGRRLVPERGLGEAPRNDTAKGGENATREKVKEIELENLFRRHISIAAGPDREGTSGRVTGVDSCVVDLSEGMAGDGKPFANLVIKDVKKSAIVCGHVDGSVHITDVRDSVVVVVARQVRVHECENVELYLHCRSNPIIEDCKGMRFAPAPEIYLADTDKPEDNKWQDVNDFKWLKSEPSPNWSVLPQEKRIGIESWQYAVHRTHDSTVGIDDKLRVLGIETGMSKAPMKEHGAETEPKRA